MSLHSNPQLELAFDYVRNTHKNIFLTGKAGTGKTTFLQQVKRETPKRMIVVAPTGVAAINAGGMTIHSFFQLPFGPFIPGNAADPSRQRRFFAEKIRLIRSLDLLVIDEISMVRADLLDAIDDVLRRFRDRGKPFGGVQLLMIGDLHQLPPIVKDEEWNLLREHYDTMYFFGSRALKESGPVSIELKHIYRQSDTTFIDLLNRIRNNRLDTEVMLQLNSRYIPDFQPAEDEPYITLTALNASAQDINAEKLAAISEPLERFEAVIHGEFPAYAFPADEIFECKTGAQVMFVKNDMNREKRFYNGKIGKITGFGENLIFVRCPGDSFDIEVSPVEWSNVKYTLNESNKEVNEEVLGTFTQYPLKLAWAITIHKSQGLTFERAIIDAQAAFAHGQVYVALSRCKSFEGIVLRSPINPSSVRTDQVVKKYTDTADKNTPDETHLERSKAEFQENILKELFDFSTLKRRFSQTTRLFLEHSNTLHQESGAQMFALETRAATEVIDVAARFSPQIQAYVTQGGLPENNAALQERLQKARTYFETQLHETLLPAVGEIRVVTDNKSVKKAVYEALEALQKEIFIKNACFASLREGFSATRYLSAKANAELDFKPLKTENKPAALAALDFSNLPHPALYARLKQWREDTADALQLERFQVMHTRVMLQLLHTLPVELNTLKKVKGIGELKARQFGDTLLDIIRDYCRENDVAPEQTAPEPSPEPKTASPNTKKRSLEAFKAGMSIEEIATERGLASSTIESHLGHFIQIGELDVFSLLAPEAVTEIVQFYVENEVQGTSPAKEHFGEKYSYAQLRMVLQYMSSEAYQSGN